MSDQGNNMALARDENLHFSSVEKWLSTDQSDKRIVDKKKPNIFFSKVSKMALEFKGVIIFSFFKRGLSETRDPF